MPVRGSAVPLTLLGDERLARMVTGDNERSFAVLYGRYRQRLYGYCYSILRDRADAQDALQSTFAAAYAALRDSRRDAPLRPWLYRIAHNEAVSLLRQRRDHSELSEEILAKGARLEDRAAERERLARLVADLRQLPERQRSALIMREFSGMSHDSIAVALRTSVGAAKLAIFEARRSLAELEQGRSMSCHEVCRIVSDRDGRVLRSRRVRSHLRDCAECAGFAAAIRRRSAELRALGPALPPAVAAGVLARATGGAGSGAGGPGSGALGIGGQAAVGLANVKVAATVLLLAATTVGGIEANRHLHGARSGSRQQHLKLVSERGSQRARDPHSAVADAADRHVDGRRRAEAGGKMVAGGAETRAAQAARGSTSISPADDPSAFAGDGAPPPSGAVGNSTQRSQAAGAAAHGRGRANTSPGSARGCEARGSACSDASPGRPRDAGGSHAEGADRSASNGKNPAGGGPLAGAGTPASGAGPQVAPPQAPGFTSRVPPGLGEPRTPRGRAQQPALHGS